MTNTRRFVLLWLAAAFIGLNGGAAALVVVDACLHPHGTARAIVLGASFVLATIILTLAVGKALTRLVAKQLKWTSHSDTES
jgi:hypothetical protein